MIKSCVPSHLMLMVNQQGFKFSKKNCAYGRKIRLCALNLAPISDLQSSFHLQTVSLKSIDLQHTVAFFKPTC